MKHSEPGLAMNHLSDNCRSRRIDADQTHIEYASPIGGRHEKGPDKIDGSVDCSRWAAQIAHRATRARVSVREGGRSSTPGKSHLFIGVTAYWMPRLHAAWPHL